MGKTVFQLSPDGGTNKYDLRDSNIAPIELDSAHASQPYAVNEEFVLDADGLLYEATSPISQGSAIIVYPTSGYNCKLSDSVTGQIKAVKDNLGTASTKNAISVVTDSSDLVESGAVKDIVGWGNKNLLSYTLDDIKRMNQNGTWNGNVYTFRDVQYTVRDDGTILVNGKASDTSTLTIGSADYGTMRDIVALDTEITLNSYQTSLSSTIRLQWFNYDGNNTTAQDTGNGITFKPTSTAGNIALYIYKGQTADNLVFKPMIRKASVTDNTYEPYHASVEDTLRDAEVVEGKNLLQNKSTSSGIFTVNSDGTITANGTLTKQALISLGLQSGFNGKYILTGLDNTFPIGSYITYKKNDSWTDLYIRPNELLQLELDLISTDVIEVFCVVSATVTITNKVFKPMLRKATETDPTYEPYYIPLKDVVPTKADNSVIAPVENGPTASQDYAVGQHFIRDGAFCTCTQPIAQGGSFILGTNYIVGDVASEFEKYIRNTININNLNDLPLGIGVANLGSDISPSGVGLIASYICFGNNEDKTVIIYRIGNTSLYINRLYNGSWSGWVSIQGTPIS